MIDVKLSNRVKPVAPPSKSTPPPPRPTADVLMSIQARQQPLRQGQEAILEKLVRDTPDADPDKPDYMFRLAEHYAQQLRFWRLKAIEPTIPRAP